MRHVLLLAALFACSPSLPPRYVMERDVGEYGYRRYQRILDVEFPVEGNAAEGHTALYIARRGGEDIELATAFVTVYERPDALSAHVRARLDALASYEVQVVRLEGEYVWRLDDGGAPVWLWVSGRHVVKLSGLADEAQAEDLAETYLDLYESDLDESGYARAGSASAGDVSSSEEEDTEPEVPSSLREGAPQ